MSSVNIFLNSDSTLKFDNGPDSIIKTSSVIHPTAGDSLSNLSDFLYLDNFSHNGSNVILNTISYTALKDPDEETIDTLVNIEEPIGYSETNERMYPPTRNLTSSSHTISDAAYGNGLYETSESSTYDTTRIGYSAFNTSMDTGPVSEANQYTNGVYSSNKFIVNDYLGDWIKIKLPVKIKLTKYGFKQRVSYLPRAPAKYKIYGSDDGINWDELVHKTTKISYTSSNFQESITTNKTYDYFAMVCNELVGTDSFLNFDEWYLYGKEHTQITPETIDENYKYLMFPYSGTLAQKDYTVNFPETEGTECDILIVGGGGGGSQSHGGGGGAGAVIFMKDVIMNGSYTIKVGKGGAVEGTAGSGTNGRGFKGNDSEIFKTTINKVVAEGGGGGGVSNTTGAGGSGGSGGGADAYNFAGNRTGGTATPYTPILDGITGIKYGNAGGNVNFNPGSGGGGGGAGGVGVTATSAKSNANGGGIGIKQATINGINYDFKTHFGLPTNNTIGQYISQEDKVYFGGGGGGGTWTFITNGVNMIPTSGIGGLGGGGAGGDTAKSDHTGKGFDGLPNTGGGGGGGADAQPIGGTGGSGIVLIRYKTTKGSITTYNPNAILKYLSPPENPIQTKGTWQTIANPTQTSDFSFTLQSSSNFSNQQAKTTTNFFDLYHSNIYTHTADSYRIILNATVDHPSTDGNKYITSALYYTQTPTPILYHSNLSVSHPPTDWTYSNISDKLIIGVTTSNLINNLKVSL